MTTLTIPARYVQTGDVIPNLGLRVSLNAESSYSGKRILYFGPADPTKTVGSVNLDPDALVTVERTDPDEALVERMAQAMADADDLPQGDWSEVTTEGKAEYRRIARAALAVVRAEQ